MEWILKSWNHQNLIQNGDLTNSRAFGLRYQIRICIRTGGRIWAHGGLLSGEWLDVWVTRNAIMKHTILHSSAK
jgi:hypothetical protein